jgi:hypothetical protein
MCTSRVIRVLVSVALGGLGVALLTAVPLDSGSGDAAASAAVQGGVTPEPIEDGRALSPGPRFWVRATNLPAGADLEYSLDGGETWIDMPLNQLIEVSNENPVQVRNVGTQVGQLEAVGSSTGDPGDLDKFHGYNFQPGARAEFKPGTLLVIAGTIVGIIKSLFGLIGSIFSFSISMAGDEDWPHRYADVQGLTEPGEASVLVSKDVTNNTVTYAVLSLTEPASVTAHCDTDPTPRPIEVDRFVMYDGQGNLTEGSWPRGGTTELLVDSSDGPRSAADGSASSAPLYAAIAGAAAAAFAVAAGGWYARRRWLR